MGEITDKLGVAAAAIPGGKGQFDVLADGRMLFSKQAEGRFPEPDETRNQDGQRRLIAGRDFLAEKVRAPDEIEVKISGIPTPAAGRTVAVALAAALARAVRRLCPPWLASDADDIAQDALLKVMKSDKGREGQAPLSAFYLTEWLTVPWSTRFGGLRCRLLRSR